MGGPEADSDEEDGQDEVCGQGEKAGGYVVEHDAAAARETLEGTDRAGFPDVEEAEKEKGEEEMLPVGGDGDEGDELAGDFVDDDVARI